MPSGAMLSEAAAFVRAHAEGVPWRALEPAFRGLGIALVKSGTPAEALHCVRLPLLVHAAVAGVDEPARPLALALLLAHIGTELLDDVSDGEIPAVWQGVPPAQIVLAAGALCAPLAQLALAEVDAPPATLATMQATFARGLLRMIGGQTADLAATGGTPSSATVEATIIAKCGGAVALYAELAAQLAGAPPAAVERYAEFGRWLGVAAQLRSEYTDLFVALRSSDLAAGTRTLPIALYLEAIDRHERDAAMRLFEAARTDLGAQEKVREMLRDAAIGRACILIAEGYCERARTALAETGARWPARRALARLIEGNSLLAMGRRRLAELQTAGSAPGA